MQTHRSYRRRYWQIFTFGLAFTSTYLALVPNEAFAQATPDAAGALSTANTAVRSYFSTASNIMYAVGGIVGLVGAIKVYSKWQEGDQNTGRTAAAWFGSCIFLVLIGAAIKTFFGIA